MKKFLLLLALMILLPTLQAQAADVPDFAEIGGGNVYFNRLDRSSDGGNVYVFNASSLNADLSNDYVGRYIRLLTSRYNFVQIGYEKKKWNSKRLNQNRPTETWYFRYNGSKSLTTLSGNCHLRIKRTRELDKGVASFDVVISPQLSIAGNYGSPKPSGGNGQRECIECNGTGRCRHCGGSGRETRWVGDGYHDYPCTYCWNGKCRDCNGTGYR